MKYIHVLLLTIVMLPFTSQLNQSVAQSKPGYVLVLIDIQEFYFPGGGYELVNPVQASSKSAEILKAFRAKGLAVVHIMHNAKNNADIYPEVSPAEGEKIIVKDHANGFVDTDLKASLDLIGADTLVICGMQTHMCVEATTRAAKDYGFSCIVIEDACATRDLKYNNTTIPAEQVHLSTLATLSKTYANILTTKQMLERMAYHE